MAPRRRFGLQLADDLYTRSRKHILFMRGFGEFAGQVLAGKMQLFVQVGAPFGAVGHIVNKALICNEFSCSALAGAAF